MNTLMGGNGWLMPHDASLDGYRIDNLILVTMVFVAILFVIMVIWIVYACVAHGPKHAAQYDHGSAKKQTLFAMGLSALIFFVVDGNLFVGSTYDTLTAFWNFAGAESHPEVIRIEVNARQWAWDMRYAGADGQFNTQDDIITRNDMRIPVDTPVVVQLGAVDVIHSFYLPHFRVKTDAVPGTINRFWFQAKETGDFEIACAQHCGMAHYKMKGILKVMTRADFSTWAHVALENAESAFSANDQEAHWGWAWKENF